MKKIIPILAALAALTACSSGANSGEYRQISSAEAQKLMESESNYIILDVRRVDEFADGHIPNAINIPNEDIGTEEIDGLPDKNALIFVYCRSGNRSKEAAKKLALLGYTRVVEIGGILDWTGDVVVEKEEDIEELVFQFRMPQADVLTYKFQFPLLGRNH